MLLERQAQIGTLRVRGAVKNDPALRLAVSSQVGNAEFQAPGLPPASILIVRHMEDPLPGKLGTQGGLRLNASWEKATQNRLSEFYRDALRPRLGVIMGKADAIVFRDEAELLSCLVLDLGRGEAWQRWWWRLILKSTPSFLGVSVSISKILCEKPSYLPAVLSFLLDWGKSKTVLQALKAEDIRNVLVAMLNVYEVRDILAAVDRPVTTGSPLSEEITQAEPSNGNAIVEDVRNKAISAPSHVRRKDNPPWTPYLNASAVPVQLDKEQSCLLGLGLMLYRLPWLARSSDFQAAVVDWWVRYDALKKSESVLDVSRKNNGEFAPGVLTTQQSTIAPDLEKPTISDATSTPIFPESQESENQQDAACIEKTENPGLLSSEQKDVPPKYENGVATRLGGILYLINLMIQLDLRRYFENHQWRLASQVSAWGLLELLGRALLEDGSDRFKEDPLWSVLAELDNREPGELPGRDFAGSKTYRLPFSWFEQVKTEGETFHWVAMHGQLRLWSSAAYLLVEAPRDENAPLLQAEKELRAYIGNEQEILLSRSSSTKPPVCHLEDLQQRGLNQDLLRWLSFTLPYIHYRLGLAFGSDFRSNSNITERLLSCPGRLYVTPTHIDFVAKINNISIEARRAGLDRDPGWLVDFGRVILFHFE